MNFTAQVGNLGVHTSIDSEPAIFVDPAKSDGNGCCIMWQITTDPASCLIVYLSEMELIKLADKMNLSDILKLSGHAWTLYKAWEAYYEARGTVTSIERAIAYAKALAGESPPKK